MAETTPNLKQSLRKRAVYILAFIALSGITFVLGVWFMFPDASLERRINAELARQAPFSSKIHHLERSFPFTLKGKQVSIDIPQFPLIIAPLQVKPAWSSLIRLQPGIVASGILFGGPFEVFYTSSGTTAIKAERMHLSATIPGFSSIRIEGELEYAQIDAHVSDVVTPSHGQIILKGVRIHGLDKVGLGQSVTTLGDLELTLEEQGRLLQLELQNPGGAFQLSGSGSITPPQLSPKGRMNLQLRIDNIPAEHAQLEELLSLTGVRKDAEGYLIRLGGRIERPILR